VRPLPADKKAAAKPVPAEARSPSPPPSYPGGMQEHTVVAGDTLTRLAWRYYQDRATAKWMKIYEANRDTIKNPDYIYIGQKIVIPAEQRESS
jgi:nucleoid-associated protein YgaU